MKISLSFILIFLLHSKGFPGGSVHKESARNAGVPSLITGLDRSLAEETAAHSSMKFHGQRNLEGRKT